MRILLSQLIILLLILNMEVLQLLDISIKLFLLLLHPLMVHFVEVSLFEELIVGGFGLLSHYDCLVELPLKILYFLA